MRKDNFLKGTFIATFYIVVSKLIGILYVIPFHAIIGEQNGALYTYAYTNYEIFLTLSTVGIPLAISKIISEYNTCGFYSTQRKVFYLSRNITVATAFMCTVVLFLFAPVFADFAINKVEGGARSKMLLLL